MLARADAELGGMAQLDPDALLCALVLTPTAWSRNRFFGLFQQPALQHARRRASILRGLLRQLRKYPDATLAFDELGEGRATLRFEVASIGYRRSSVLSAMERALLQYEVARGAGRPTPLEARAKVESALAKLGP